MSNQTVKRDYKDSLFRLIFASEENKEFTLSLYNAVNGSNYTDPSKLRLNTLERAVFLGMHNDVSFVIDTSLELYEHQSTYNPNMPLRGLFYLADVLEKELHLEETMSRLYSTKLLRLPTPQIVVFYNGKKRTEDQFELHLSDSFDDPERACIELTVKVVNINFEHNKAFMEKCLALRQYAEFVAMVRRSVSDGVDREEAIQTAMDEIVGQNKGLSTFFKKHRAEVTGVFLEEYNEDEVHQVFLEDGLEQGDARTMELFRMIQNGASDDNIMETLNCTLSKIQEARSILAN